MDLRAGTSSDSYAPRALFANDGGIRGGKKTIKSGAGALLMGTVLGAITIGAATSAAKAGGNTGGGTLTLDVTTPILAHAKVGVYSVRCILAPGSNGGTFLVLDPDGFSIGQVVVGATFANQLKFVIADVGTDFALGDGFDITVAAGSGKFVKSLSTAVDGSQYPDAILGEDIDATSADKEALAYDAGEFNSDNLILGDSHTVASIRPGLRTKGIFLK